MSESLPPRLVLDQELLARLGPQSSRQEWERTLRRTGLAGIHGGPTRAGALLTAIQRGVSDWPEEARSEIPLRPAVPALIGGLLLLLATFFDFSGNFLVGLLGVIGLGAALFLRSQQSGGDQDLEQRAQRHVLRLSQQLHSFLGLSFVEAMGGSIVELTPHLSWLQLRIQQLEQAGHRIAVHREEMAVTAARIRNLNLQLGRDPEDEETQQLAALEQQQLQLAHKVEEMRLRLKLLEKQLEERLERRRTWVERQALSARAGHLAELEGGEALADAELDVVQVEATLKELALEEVQEDLRIRALLEVSALERS